MISINLVPPEIKDKIKEAKKTASIFGVALVIVIFLAVASALVRAANYMVLEPALTSVNNQVATSQNELKEFLSLQNQAATINDRMSIASKIEEKKARWSQITQDLINSVPQNIQFVSLTANAEKSPNFVLQGKTNSEREVIAFKDKLEKATFFKNVAFKSSTTTNPSDNPSTTAETQKIISFALEFDLSKLFYDPNQKENK